MNLHLIRSLAQRGRARLLVGLQRLSQATLRMHFLHAASSSGVLKALAAGPLSVGELAGRLQLAAGMEGGLQAWLEVGVLLGELGREGERFGLEGWLARRLAQGGNEDIEAILAETIRLHTRLIVETPERLKEGRRFTLADQDGELVAQASRILEPVVQQAIDQVVPKGGEWQVLEVGCGSGTYLRYMGQRNTGLRAVGLELQAEVAELAKRNLLAWGLAGRSEVRHGDFLAQPPEPRFDLVTFHNNIYYFPLERRVELLQHARRFLKPGGQVLLTSGCRGVMLGVEILNLWGAVTEGCGPLPTASELSMQLEEAGFAGVTATSLMPGGAYCAFSGRQPDGG